MFNARAESSALYPLIAEAGVGGAVPLGGSTTGKLYFDVVGDVPNSVVYNDGIRDVLAWVPGPPWGVHAPSGSGAASPTGRCVRFTPASPGELTLCGTHHPRVEP